MKIKLPEQVSYIIGELEKHGFEAYAVGGCVRDSILGRIPDDWDITTSAKPEQVKEIFKKTVDTGIEHGTVTVMIEKTGYEVTTYRIDGEYEDSRHPKEVVFTSNLVEDLKRRDFTINAMAYSETAGLVDVFDGIGDINRKMIRCVGKAKERFSEDALRILRAVRFAAQLKFQIEEETKEAIEELAVNLKNISAERIQTELVKLLVSKEPERIREACELGITKVILPEFDAMMTCTQENIHHMYTVGEHTVQALKQIEADKVLRLAILFHDTGKVETKTIDEQGVAHFYNHAIKSAEISQTVLRRLKFDNDTIGKVKKLVELHDHRPSLKKSSVRRLAVKSGTELFEDLIKVKRADTLAQSEYEREEKLAYLDNILQLYQEIIRDNECIKLKDMQINGNDLKSMGIPQGKEMGKILNELFEMVLEEPEKNQKEFLCKYVKEHYIS
jgi:tRNA nucleotidyltransferase (CCA-adding enzyme)